MSSVGFLPELENKTGHFVGNITMWLAVFGGLLLAAIAIITVISIFGRALVSFGLVPILGDFELVEAGCAVAVFSFLPWCQYNRGHVTVDILTDKFPLALRAFFVLIGNVAMSLVAYFIARQMWPGLVEKFIYNETTYVLGMPVWYGYALAYIGSVIFVITCFYSVWRSFNELIGAINPPGNSTPLKKVTVGTN